MKAIVPGHGEQRVPTVGAGVRLCDIGPLTDGDWILSSDYSTEGVRLLQVGDVGAGHFVGKSNRFISHARARELACTMLREGDILISRMPEPMGRACRLPALNYPAITAVDVSIWRPDPKRAHSGYLVYALNSPGWFHLVQSRAAGATRARISRGNLEQLRIRLPRLEIQERIAARLDQVMGAVDAARRAAEDRLVAAEALRRAYLREVFEGAHTVRWKTCRLGQLLRRHNEVIHPGDRQGEAQFVGLEHIEPNTGRRLGSGFVDFGKMTGRKPTFRRGQIVYGYLRPYLNKVWIAEFNGCSSVDQFAFDVIEELADARFVAAFMKSSTFLERSRVVTTSGQLPRISIDEIESVSVAVPPLPEQRIVAADLTLRLEAAEAAINSCRNQLREVSALRPSVLHDALNED